MKVSVRTGVWGQVGF